MDYALVAMYLGFTPMVDFTAEYSQKTGSSSITWIVDPHPTEAEMLAAEPLAIAAKAAADAEAEIDRQNRLDLKTKIIDFRNDMDSIITAQQVYIDTPATNNVGRDAHLNQIAKDLKQLARDFKQLANVVKGLA